MNKVAIIVPVYNAEKWIAECIDSIKAQTFDGLECLVVDDGSTDRSFELVRESIDGDNRFRVVRQRNLGLSAARNVGLDLTDSELVMYVDSDDYVLPEFASSAVSFLEENNLQMAFFNGDVANFNSRKRIFVGEQLYIRRYGNYGEGTGQEMFCRLMQRNAYVYAVFLQIIRRDCIRHRFCNGILAQDRLYTTQNLLYLDRVGYLQDVLYIKRSHDGSAVSSRRGMHMLYSKAKIFLEMEKYIEKYGSNLSEETICWLGIMLQRSLNAVVGIWNRMDAGEQQKISTIPPEARVLLQMVLGKPLPEAMLFSSNSQVQ